MERYGVIYKITNLNDGRCYIGQTVQHEETRWQYHIKHSKTPLNKAFKKYGIENFKFEVLMTCFDREYLNKMEKEFILVYNSYLKGYNQTTGGESTVFTEEVRNKMRKAKLGKTGTKTRWIKVVNNLTGEEKIVYGVKGAVALGINSSNIRLCLCGKRKQAGNHSFSYIENDANESGSTEIKNSEHAQRLESEPTKVEQNDSTRHRDPRLYITNNKDQIIKDYLELNSSYKVAEKHNLVPKTLRVYLKVFGVLEIKNRIVK